MTYPEYLTHFEAILNHPSPLPPYNNPDYLHYTRLNYTRMKRWTKTGRLDAQLVQTLQALAEPQQWIVLVEPWCGDVAPTLPLLVRLAESTAQVSLTLQLRDSEPFLINHYLTGGSKSIPKLIVRNAAGSDLAVWGPRPAGAQALMDQLKKSAADFETVKTALQDWYNKDAGRSLQAELLALQQHRETVLGPSA